MKFAFPKHALAARKSRKTSEFRTNEVKFHPDLRGEFPDSILVYHGQQDVCDIPVH